MFSFSVLNKLKKFVAYINTAFNHQKNVESKTIKVLFYKPPKDTNGKSLWCPVVIKDSDTLISAINTFHFTCSNIESALEGINVKLSVPILLPFDSGRFNDIIKDGRRQRDMSDIECQQVAKQNFNAQTEYFNPDTGHGENLPFEKNIYYFSIDCPSCNIPYNWNSPDEIPTQDFYCSNCHRLLIHYIGISDKYLTYDG